MRKLDKRAISFYISLKRFLYTCKREKRKRKRKAGKARHEITMKKYAEAHGTIYNKKTNRILSPKPKLSQNIQFLSQFPDLFSTVKNSTNDNGHFIIPETFSLIDNYKESFNFLKRLFFVLHKGVCKKLILDYVNCKRIDVDASICMDIILGDFLPYLNGCHARGYSNVFPKEILPINFEREEIMKVLFSIGAYRNLTGLKIDYPDIEDLPVLINNQNFANKWRLSEIHTTDIVEYIKRCLKRMNRELTIESETGFYKVIGEIMSNAEEHGTMPHRFAIGFFQETHNNDEHFGIFNLSIFNFGKTIYETFKSPECLNTGVVKQMTELSEDYTEKGWLTKAEFEEETLWTLYSLQEGVTSKEKKRGNGSIQYIRNFFGLKGDMEKDDVSKMLLISGNTRILFDGTYNITEKQGVKRKFKMMTFNDSGDITEKPNKNFVTFAPHFFPGTIISARILIKFDNTNQQDNGTQNN